MDILDLHFENFYIFSSGIHHHFSMYLVSFLIVFSLTFIKPTDTCKLPAPVSNKTLNLTPSTNITTTEWVTSPWFVEDIVGTFG